MEANREAKLDLLIVGSLGGTHVCSSLLRGAQELGLAAAPVDIVGAFGRGLPQSLAWRLFDKYPLRLRSFLRDVRHRMESNPPRVFLVLGGSPMTPDVLQDARRLGIRCAHFSTDDPFNPLNGSRRLRESLPEYDVVFTPRRANMDDLRGLGCSDVRYLPFAFDPSLFFPLEDKTPESSDILFVGGGDADRRAFFEEYLRHGGPAPSLVGAYWDRFPELRSHWKGVKSPEELRRLTAAAAVNICLVRRANRDGHVMRSFEIPALGGFMLAEDTPEHRDLFGPDGECLRYFSSPEDAANLSMWALEHPRERRRMADALHARVTQGGHTYAERIRTMLAAFD